MPFVLLLVNLLYYAALILLFARVFLPLLGVSPYHPVSEFVYRVTEPVLEPIRRRLPQTGPFDFSPMIVLIILVIIRELLFSLFLR